MSNNLQQLRKIFKNDSLIREKNKMVLTSFAKKLQPRLHAALGELKDIVEFEKQFDISQCTRTFKIATPNHFSSLIFPTLIPILEKTAPNIKINVISQMQLYNAASFEKDNCDIVITRGTSALPTNIHAQLILKEHNICILNVNHPLAKKNKISLEDYVSYKHVARRTENPLFPSIIDAALEAKGLKKRDAIIYLPFPDSVFKVIEKSDSLIGNMSISAAAIEIKHYPQCIIKPFPFEIQDVEFYIAWDKQFSHDLAHQWLREQIITIAKGWDFSKLKTPSLG